MSRDREAAVLVVGAGPAGSSVALRLARDGVPVTMLDARAFPRSKPCGDCLSPGATPLLEELGVLGALDASGAGQLSGWRIRTPSGRWFTGRFGRTPGGATARVPGIRDAHAPPGPPPASGLSMPRRDLDAALVRAAVEEGAALRERVRVFDLVRDGDRVAGVRARDRRGREVSVGAEVVVGADGLRSVVARRLAGVRRGPRPRLALVGRFAGVRAPDVPRTDPTPGSPRGPTPTPPDARRPTVSAGEATTAASDDGRDRRFRAPTGEMRLGEDGCLGLAPVGEGRWNATLVVPADRAGDISRDRGAFFRRGLRTYGVAHRFRDARAVEGMEVTGPFRMGPRRRVAPGVLLAGDAAGYFDPLTGQGVFRALATGRAAARTVRDLLDAASEAARAAARRRYAGDLRRLLAPGRRVQATLDFICRHPALIEGAGALLRSRPALASLLVDVAGDRFPAAALLDPRRVVPALLPKGGSPSFDGRPRPRTRHV
jgi:flavin-dependent dehydrogenase